MQDSIIPTKGNKFSRLHINTCMNWPSCAYPSYTILMCIVCPYVYSQVHARNCWLSQIYWLLEVLAQNLNKNKTHTHGNGRGRSQTNEKNRVRERQIIININSTVLSAMQHRMHRETSYISIKWMLRPIFQRTSRGFDFLYDNDPATQNDTVWITCKMHRHHWHNW